jgi:hypothetical protein
MHDVTEVPARENVHIRDRCKRYVLGVVVVVLRQDSALQVLACERCFFVTDFQDIGIQSK